jgi:hypothetical protein
LGPPPGKREAQELKLSANEERQILDAAKRRRKRGMEVGEIIELLDRPDDLPEVHNNQFPFWMQDPSETVPPLDGVSNLLSLEEGWLSLGPSLSAFGYPVDIFGESHSFAPLGFSENSEE